MTFIMGKKKKKSEQVREVMTQVLPEHILLRISWKAKMPDKKCFS